MPIPSDHRRSYIASSIVMLPVALEDMMNGEEVNFEKVTGTRGVTGGRE